MSDTMTRFAVHAAGELGLQDIAVERRTKHMRLMARTDSGAPVLVGFQEKSTDWRCRKHLISELRRQARAVTTSAQRECVGCGEAMQDTVQG
jgi:hypothetical protein